MSSDPIIVPPLPISMKTTPAFNEAWLHDLLIKQPALLGLGDLDVRDSERRQPSGGRLDLLLSDPETRTRYEVEIQLGEIDAAHIIRTIEYWDIERKRYPQYEHIAVIVAEKVTSRFLNVINLFNGAIPLIAIQLQLIEVNKNRTLIASRIVERIRLSTEEEDEGVEVDRAWWMEKASPESLAIVDELIGRANEVVSAEDAPWQPKYNKHYITLKQNGKLKNFMVFNPRKKFTVAKFKIEHDEQTENGLAESGLELLPYASQYGEYQIRLVSSELTQYREQLDTLIYRAHEQYHSL